MSDSQRRPLRPSHPFSTSKLRRRVIHRGGFSLLEMIAVVTILGILAAIVVPRISHKANESRGAACHVNRGNIEVQAQLYFRNTGQWPRADLSDIGGDTKYFPDALPNCPVDGSRYTFDSATQKVVGHDHP